MFLICCCDVLEISNNVVNDKERVIIADENYYLRERIRGKTID